MEIMLQGWFFVALDVRGRRSWGLAVGWNSRTIKVSNYWGFEDFLGL